MWFRRDLRLSDNPALLAALDHGPTLPVFVLDPALWGPAGHRRRAYLSTSLHRLDADIRALGGPGLHIALGDPAAVIPAIAAEHAAVVFATADAGPYGATRDRAVAAACEIRFVASPYLHPPGSVRKGDGAGYRVFTPFYRAWRALPLPAPAPAPSDWPAWPGETQPGRGWADLADLADPRLAAGEDQARQLLSDFVEHRMRDYGSQRDLPAEDGTSKLSAALKFGELHPRTVVAVAAEREGAEVFIRQLCWRDFYGHYLAARPETARTNVQPAFDAFPWADGQPALEAFEQWRDGRTGFPFVDAGMRHLASAGTMPNRLRMVVASFLVKDLHLDWRWGARHFMQQLYDGDLANNQHGWQWTAGSGTDAAPYYRIFNPVLQGLKFDPAGDYVRTWVPELRGLPGAAAHEPWRHPRQRWPDYPERLVNHAQERDEAMRRYESIRTRA